MAFDVTKIEAVLKEITDPAVLDKLNGFLTTAESSGAFAFLESRWPGISTVDKDLHLWLGFLSKLDATIVPYLPLIFKILDTLFPPPVAA